VTATSRVDRIAVFHTLVGRANGSRRCCQHALRPTSGDHGPPFAAYLGPLSIPAAGQTRRGPRTVFMTASDGCDQLSICSTVVGAVGIQMHMDNVMLPLYRESGAHVSYIRCITRLARAYRVRPPDSPCITSPALQVSRGVQAEVLQRQRASLHGRLFECTAHRPAQLAALAWIVDLAAGSRAASPVPLLFAHRA
jgi:hypothetical protein